MLFKKLTIISCLFITIAVYQLFISVFCRILNNHLIVVPAGFTKKLFFDGYILINWDA